MLLKHRQLGLIVLGSLTRLLDAADSNIPYVNVSDCSLVFRYKQLYYTGCTDVDSEGAPWCLLKKASDGPRWGYCNMNTLHTYYADDQGQRKDCDVSTKTSSGGSAFGCYSSNDQKTYTCQAGGKELPCLIALPGSGQEFRRPPIEANGNGGYNYSNYPNNRNRSVTPDMTSAAPAGATDAMSLQLILVLSILGGLAVLSAVVLVIIRRSRNRSARNQLEAKLKDGSGGSSKYLIGPPHFNNSESSNFSPPSSFHNSKPTTIESSGGWASPAVKEFTVITTYTPTLSDELVIRPGDKVVIYKRYDDGWVQGANLTRGGAKGVFPRHCIEPLSDNSPLATNGDGRPTSKRSSSNVSGYNDPRSSI